MDKINPSNYITDTDPADIEAMDASGWYELETMQVAKENEDQLPWLYAQGWQYVKQEISTDTQTRSEYVGLSWDQYYDIMQTDYVDNYDSLHDTWYSTYYEDDGNWEEVSNEVEKEFTFLQRNVLKSEYALNTLIASYTDAYNEGRTLNDTRYDDIVALYTVMLDKTEDDIISLNTEDTTYDGLIEALLAQIVTDYDSYKTAIDEMFDDYGTDRRAEINTDFANRLAEQKANLIAKGIYNTTIWNAVTTANQREETKAENNLEDGILDKQIGIEDRLYTAVRGVRTQVLAARDRLRQQLQGQSTERIGLRNQVLEALTRFMERRTDGYPDLASMGNMVERLGAGVNTGVAE